MYIGNNWMVCGTFYRGLPVNEYFIDEKSAREYANRLYNMSMTKSVELLKRQRVGYVKVKKIVRHHEGASLWIEKENQTARPGGYEGMEELRHEEDAV